MKWSRLRDNISSSINPECLSSNGFATYVYATSQMESSEGGSEDRKGRMKVMIVMAQAENGPTPLCLTESLLQSTTSSSIDSLDYC